MEPINIIIYYRENCPYSDMALSKLEDLKMSNKITCYRKYNAGDKNGKCFKAMVNKSGRKTYPQIFANNILIGGYDDLINHLNYNHNKIVL